MSGEGRTRTREAADTQRQLLEQQYDAVHRLEAEVQRVIVGQEHMIEGLLVGLLSNGHVLLEGVPGLAKTLAINTLAKTISASFQRVQFTPDLLPADLIGTMIYNQREADFEPRLGPIFANLVLADEINRAPAKVQSALLEAMQERQVTIGKETFRLAEPFLVLATQNPIEQEGTYPLPEAQVDRFLQKIEIGYPRIAEERQIIDRNFDEISVREVISPEEIVRLRVAIAKGIYIDEAIEGYILRLVFVTRKEPELLEEYGLQDMSEHIAFGSSPRGSQALKAAARVYAFLRRRQHVIPEDIETAAPDVLRHRLILSHKAEAEEITPNAILRRILEKVPVP
jgi:MoxR-like ATPase